MIEQKTSLTDQTKSGNTDDSIQFVHVKTKLSHTKHDNNLLCILVLGNQISTYLENSYSEFSKKLSCFCIFMFWQPIICSIDAVYVIPEHIIVQK